MRTSQIINKKFSFTMWMWAAGFSEMSGTLYQVTQQRIPEDTNL
jgi:hypothetical protein